MQAIEPRVDPGASSSPCGSSAKWVLFLCAGALAACGGGTAVPPTPVDDAAAGATLNGRSMALALPQSYTGTLHLGPYGSAGSISYALYGGPRGRLIDSNGQFVADSSIFGLTTANLLPGGVIAGEGSSAAGLTPHGIAVGWMQELDGTLRGFAFHSSTGRTDILPGHTLANFISESGIVGGRFCPPASACRAFHWRASADGLVEHLDFAASWMNNAGTMIGHYEPAGQARQLATVSLDGVMTPVLVDPVPGRSAEPQFIADDGSIFINTEGNLDGAFVGDAVVIVSGTARSVGGGIAPLPDICGACDCVARTAFTAFSATGHAVGMHTVHYRDPSGTWQIATETGFHWTARDGETAIKVDTADAIPTAVNSQGIVAGSLADPAPFQQGEIFVWQRDAGGVLLRSLLASPSDGRGKAEGIGDGGHLVITRFDPFQPDATSLTVYAPEPPVSEPGD
jgi:hypothetical protein